MTDTNFQATSSSTLISQTSTMPLSLECKHFSRHLPSSSCKEMSRGAIKMHSPFGREREHPLRVVVLPAFSGLSYNLEITVHFYSYLPDGTYHMGRLHQHTHFRYRQEDLGLYGNQLNYMQTCWTVGYVIGEIPSNIMLTKIRPRYWLPALEVCRQSCFYSISRH